MTVDEVGAEYSSVMAIPMTKDRDAEFDQRAALLQYEVLTTIADMADAAHMRALARAAIGDDDEAG